MLKEILQHPYYAHRGRASITVWNADQRVCVQSTQENIRLIMHGANRLPDIEIVKEKKRKFICPKVLGKKKAV